MGARTTSDGSGHGTQACSALRSALVSLMLGKPFDRIGVKELCAAAHVSRSTFYAYYRNTDELLAEVEDEHVGAISALNERVGDPRVSDMGFYAETLAYVDEHADDFRALLVTSPDLRFQEAWKDAIKGHLRGRRAASGRAALPELALEVASSAVVSAYAYHLANPGKVGAGEAIATMQRALAALDS